MATPADIEEIRRLTGNAEGYTDEQIGAMIDGGMTLNQIAYRIWNEVAASAATLVDTSESGSSRKLSDLHKNALTMAAMFKNADAPLVTSAVVRTRRAVRG